MNFRKVELDDQGKINGIIREWQFDNAEASFANLFIWRHLWDISYTIEDNVLFYWMKYGNREFAFTPVPLRKKELFVHIMKVKDYMLEQGLPFLMRCNDIQAKLLKEECPGIFEYTPDPVSFEYIYNGDDLRELAGKKYHAKRNHINALLANHECEYINYSHEFFEDCINVYDSWMENKDDLSRKTDYERLSVIDALQNYDRLGFKACVIKVDGKIEAFSLGEMINSETALIHIEKANANINGLYPYVNREFARNAFPNALYINREEDLGIEGLRKAKQSYHPVRLLEKYFIIFK